jgi:hypothetical protein
MISRNSAGEIIFSAVDDRDELVSSLKEILTSTDVGRDYKKNYHAKERSDEDGEKIVAAAIQIAGGPMISSRHLQHALTLLIDSGEIKSRNAVEAEQLEEPEEDLRPRDRNGKILTPEQISWGEMSRFAATATADQVRQRKNTDHKFREFIQTNLRREMREQPVGDEVTVVGQPTTKTRANQDLVDFVRKFHAEPSQNLRPRNNVVLLAGEQVPYPRFIEMVNAASNAHLL